MKFKVRQWTLIDLYKRRNQINFPVYQRGEVWYEERKKLLVDSILQGIDIPKLYLQKMDMGSGVEWDCIDGHQRINAIVGFFNEEFEFENLTFKKLQPKDQEKFENYKLTITEITEISPEEVRLLFTRLQLGIPLNSGEKLNAIHSNMNNFVKKMAKSRFIRNISIPMRRFAKEQVCAQICNNSRFLNKSQEFRNSKFEDLDILYRTYSDFELESDKAKGIVNVLRKLNNIFEGEAAEIRNRAGAVSIFFFVETLLLENNLKGREETIKKFYLKFLRAIKSEVRKGLDAENRWLMGYQSKVLQGADSRSSIETRHLLLLEAFLYFLKTKKIIGYD